VIGEDGGTRLTDKLKNGGGGFVCSLLRKHAVLAMGREATQKRPISTQPVKKERDPKPWARRRGGKKDEKITKKKGSRATGGGGRYGIPDVEICVGGRYIFVK